MIKKIILSGLIASAFCMTGYAAGDDANTAQGPWLVRLRALEVIPDASSSNISVIGGEVNRISNAFVPELDVSYFFTPHLATELILGTTRHSVTATNTALGSVDLGNVSLLPPTLTLQYHFMPEQLISPYVGAGINYTYFYDINHGPVATSISYSNSFGPALQLGADIRLNKNWFFNVDAKKIWIKSNVNVKALGENLSTTVKINPMVYGVGVGYRFG